MVAAMAGVAAATMAARPRGRHPPPYAAASTGSDAGAADTGVPPDAGFANVNAVTLDGVDERITIADDAALETSTTMSFCLWLRGEEVTWPNTKAVVARNGTSNAVWQLQTRTTQGMRFYVASSLTALNEFLLCNTGFSGQTEYHLCVTYNAGTAKMYRNGSEIAGCTLPAGSLPASLLTTSNAAISIGGNTTGTPLSFNATVDFFAYWTSELSASDVTDAYNSGAPGDPGVAPYTSATLLLPLGEYGDTASSFFDYNVGHDGTGVNLESGDIAASPF